MKYINYLKLITLFILLLNAPSYGQDHHFDENFEKVKDLFTIYPNKKAVAKDSTLYPSKLIMAPIIGYAPETSLGMGIGAKYLFNL